MQWMRRGALAFAACLMLGLSMAVWYFFTAPSPLHLPLAQDLVDATSPRGQQLLDAAVTARVDFAQLAPYFVPQARRAFCGVATATMVLNAIHPPTPLLTQETLFTPAASAVRSELAVSVGGMTLQQFSEILQAHGLETQTVHAEQTNLESFRAAVQATLAEPLTFLVVNYDRVTLQQEGSGHISPVGAYNVDSDQVLILDVAANKYPYTWVPTQKLWDALNTADSASGRTRGFVLARGGGARR